MTAVALAVGGVTYKASQPRSKVYELQGLEGAQTLEGVCKVL